MLRYLAVFVPLFAVMVTSNNNMLIRLGLEPGNLLAALVAALIALLIFEYRAVYLAAALLVAVAANLSPDTALNLGFERDYALAALLSILLTPRIVTQLD